MARKRQPKNKTINKEDSKIKESVVPPKDEAEKDVASDSRDSGKNDPEWYNRDPQLLLDAASIPFNTPFGASLPLVPASLKNEGAGIAGVKFASNLEDESTPGICSLIIKPSCGLSLDKNSPLNVAANAFYTHVRYINSGRKNYDPADLMIYAMAFADIYSYIIWCERIYAYAFMYSQRNYYLGKDLLKANGVDPNNIVANLANFRYWINSVINKVSSFCLPGDINFFKRRAFLYQNFYLENPYGNIKDQVYQMVPGGFMQFQLNASGAGTLHYVQRSCYSDHHYTLSSFQTYNDIRDIFNTLMANITGDEDFGIMSGDVLKAYGANIIGLPQMGPEVDLLPVYDPFVLSQFKNAAILAFQINATGATTETFTRSGETFVYGDLGQTTDGLLVSLEGKSSITSKAGGIYHAINKPLSSENPQPDVGDVIEATRLMVAGYSQNGTVGWVTGTEVVLVVSFTIAPSATGSGGEGSKTTYRDNTLNPLDADMKTSYRDFYSTCFKYAPNLMVVQYSDNDADLVIRLELVSNVDNLTLVDNSQLQRLHEVALLSLFYVPGVAKLLS